MLGLIGKKIGMTQVFEENGNSTPVTVIHCEPNEMLRTKSQEKDGYVAAVIGCAKLKKEKKAKKFAHVNEFKISEESIQPGEAITIDIFKDVKKVKVTGTSKGKGFQGTIKRFNFSRGPESHGSHHHREPGSVGACAKPGRIHRGKKLPGRMGGETTTLSSVKIIHMDAEKNLLCLKGSIPGANGGYVRIEIES